jgi:hypothetical protein
LHKGLKPTRVSNGVIIQSSDEWSVGSTDALVDRSSKPEILVVEDYSDRAVLGDQTLTAVIDNNHVEVPQSLPLERLQALVQSRIRRQCRHNDRGSGVGQF